MMEAVLITFIVLNVAIIAYNFFVD